MSIGDFILFKEKKLLANNNPYIIMDTSIFSKANANDH